MEIREEDPFYFFFPKNYNPRYYLFSFCIFCELPAFAYKDHVSCASQCFDMKVKTNEFSEKYTLEHFLKLHYEFRSKHSKCESDIKLLFIDEETKDTYFFCDKCQLKILNENFKAELRNNLKLNDFQFHQDLNNIFNF